jgi:hypothetical protein
MADCITVLHNIPTEIRHCPLMCSIAVFALFSLRSLDAIRVVNTTSRLIALSIAV